MWSMRARKRTTAKSKRLEKPIEPPPPPPPLAVVAAATPTFGVPVTVGSMDANDWLKQLGIPATDSHWFVEIALGIDESPLTDTWRGEAATRLHVFIYPQEWGFLFCHANQTSWIRIADRAYVHGRDDYALVSSTPPLRELSAFARELERRHQLAFRRDRALVRTNLLAIDDRVRDWAAAL